MSVLEPLELAHQRIVLAVRDLGLAHDMVQVVVPLDLSAERFDSLGDALAHQFVAKWRWSLLSRSGAPGFMPSSTPTVPDWIGLRIPAP